MEAPEYYYYCPSTDKASAASAAGEHFVVDDLLDFSNAEAVAGAGFFDNAAANSADSSVITASAAVDSCNSSVCGDNGGNNNNNNNSHHINGAAVYLNSFYGGTRSFGGGECNLSGELCVPCDDLAELEWLSNFVEDSFSAKQPSLFLPAAAAHPSKPGSSSTNTPTHHGPLPPLDSSPVFLPDPSPLPSKSRSKRPRAIPCDWTTRLLHLTVSATTETPPRASSSKRESGGITGTGIGTGGPEATPRRCLHCAAEKTPQWRTGPLGPKTLCNACGVRYKSGRLVPEYRPAASPTFVSTKHSNSHRKVIELRRQKDIQRVHPHPHPHHHPQFIVPSPIYGGGVNDGDYEYLIGGPGFRHMI